MYIIIVLFTWFKRSFTIQTSNQALNFKKYSAASDVWSYGAVMYEILSVGHKPFENYQNNQVSATSPTCN